MNVAIGTTVDTAKPTGVAQYWARLRAALRAAGIPSGVMNPRDARNPDCLVIVDNQDACLVPDGVPVVAVQHGSAGEHLKRVASWKAGPSLVERQKKAAKRPRTFWVACSKWANVTNREHMGVTAKAIIEGCVDTDAFKPSERQRVRNTPRPVVLHHCADPNKGSAIIGAVEKVCRWAEFRRLDCAPDKVPDAMRKADMWLCLSAAEGLPTVVQEALASGLVVVGTNVGVLWDKDVVNRTGATVFDWRERGNARLVAGMLEKAWAGRIHSDGRSLAVQEWSIPAFRDKWLKCLASASKELQQ